MSENGSITRLELLRVEEVSSILRISKTQGYRLVKAGQLPAVIFGRSVRIRGEDLDNFIIAHTGKVNIDPAKDL